MPPAKLNWSTARVEDAELDVRLEGEIPKGWKKSFRRTVRLLGGGQWGEIAVKKRTVHVTDVVPGEEEKLRHYLESVVEQANAAHPPAERDGEAAERDGQAADGDGDEPAREDPNAQMTAQFRSFAEDAHQRSASGA
jgi:hypothetical protein